MIGLYLALLTEYWGDPDSAKSSIKYAWYHVPILSDSPSAEFIRFRKYTTGDVLDEMVRREPMMMLSLTS